MKRLLAALLLLMLGCAALAEADRSGVADAADMTDVVDVVEAGMVPVTAEALNDGVYEVAVESSSSMFKVVGCQLTVEDGQMTATLRMKSEAYSYMYPGSAGDAAQADEADLLPLEIEGEGFYFDLPVPALDAGVECAAFSAKKQLWYPRTLLFRADSLPPEAWREKAGVELADGAYLVNATLEGGRARLVNPVALTVENGACFARLVFTTKKIDYVIVNGEKLLPEAADEGVAFTVPVAAFDRGLSVIVDSTAIQPATEVDYIVTFDSASVVSAE